MTAITAVTTQNTSGVFSILKVPINEIKNQIKEGVNFFETGREHYTKYLPPRLAAAYYYFFDKDLTIVDKVSPKKNRAILFPSSMIHAGSNPIKNKLRIVINFVFSEEKVQGIKNYYKLGDADKAMFQDMGNVFDNFKLGEKV